MTIEDEVITILATSEAQLRTRVRSLEADIDAYRALAQQLLHALHDLTVRHDQLRRSEAQLRALMEGRWVRPDESEAA